MERKMAHLLAPVIAGIFLLALLAAAVSVPILAVKAIRAICRTLARPAAYHCRACGYRGGPVGEATQSPARYQHLQHRPAYANGTPYDPNVHGHVPGMIPGMSQPPTAGQAAAYNSVGSAAFNAARNAGQI
jgi:hypothetical protein